MATIFVSQEIAIRQGDSGLADRIVVTSRNTQLAMARKHANTVMRRHAPPLSRHQDHHGKPA
jgi:hypothetical protein